MPTGKAEARLTAASSLTNMRDHNYTPMETSTNSAGKRKNPPVTPTTSPAPPAKIKTPQEQMEIPNEPVKAVEKLTAKIDNFGEQLRENSIMVANVTKLVEMNAADIKECKTKIQAMGKEKPRLLKENEKK